MCSPGHVPVLTCQGGCGPEAFGYVWGVEELKKEVRDVDRVFF